jgi:hypothetical protein
VSCHEFAYILKSRCADMKLKSRCADMNHAKDGTGLLRRSSRQRSHVSATSETSTESVPCLLTENTHERHATVKDFKTELKSWLQSLEELTKLCHGSKFSEAKSSVTIQDLTSCLAQVTELCRYNLSQTICADCAAIKAFLKPESSELHVPKNMN